MDTCYHYFSYGQRNLCADLPERLPVSAIYIIVWSHILVPLSLKSIAEFMKKVNRQEIAVLAF